MPSYLIYGHGNRGVGTTTGTYVVPRGVTIYFFESDGELLNNQGATLFIANLLRADPREAAVQGVAIERKTEFDSVPNYTCSGDAALNPPSGVHLVGQVGGAPVMQIGAGARQYLADIVGSLGAGPHTIYWLCCRANPINTNTATDRVTLTQIAGQAVRRERQVRDVGLRPSQVVARGGQWQR